MTARSVYRILGGCVLAVYVGTLCVFAFPFGARGTFVSPDEHATWTFAREIAHTGIARIAEVRNEAVGNILYPRSTLALGSFIVPSGFLGTAYVGAVLALFVPWGPAFLGPLMSILVLFAFYSVVRHVSSSRTIALVTIVLVAVHPAWWYYSMRSLMPNVPFVAWLLFALWAYTRAYVVMHRDNAGKRPILWGLLSGIFFGLAGATRAFDMLWVGMILVGLGVVAWRRGILRTLGKILLAACAGCALVGVGMLCAQYALYGSPFVTGYTAGGDVVDVETARQDVAMSGDGQLTVRTNKIMGAVFPFGIHERTTLRHAWQYGVALYPWMAVVLLGGFIWWTVDHRRLAARHAWLALPAAYLVVVYGSWVVHDNPDVSVISLGNSYVRYWLPLFVALAPFGAYGVLRMRDAFLARTQHRILQNIVRTFPVIIIALCTTLSFWLVFWGDDGVFRTRAALVTFEEKRVAVLDATEPHAVIIVDRADKYLWPDRAVVVPLRSETTYARIPALLDTGPLYYFSITLPEEDLQYLHNDVFAHAGIRFIPVFTLQEETLYAIVRE